MKRLLITSLLLLTATVVVVYYFKYTAIDTNTASGPKGATAPEAKNQPSFVGNVETIVERAAPIPSKQKPVADKPLVEVDAEPELPYEYWHEVQVILRASYRVEDLVVAAIYDQIEDPDLGGNNIALAEESLFRAYHIDPNNALVNHQIMNFCGKRPEYVLCTLPYAHNLLLIDEDNATLLNELSHVYYQNFDFNQALYLLNKAAVVERSDSYYGRYMAAIDKAFVNNGFRFMRTRENLDLYPRLAAASVNKNFANVLKMCDERVGFQLEQWRLACRDAGKNIADRSLDYVSQGYGVRQYVRYAGINFTDQEIAVRAVARERAKIVGATEAKARTTNARIPIQVWEQFIRDMQDNGEGKAYQNLEEKMRIYR